MWFDLSLQHADTHLLSCVLCSLYLCSDYTNAPEADYLGCFVSSQFLQIHSDDTITRERKNSLVFPHGEQEKRLKNVGGNIRQFRLRGLGTKVGEWIILPHLFSTLSYGAASEDFHPLSKPC